MNPHRVFEVKSYLVPFTQLSRPVFWFNDPFAAGTWSNLHCHDDWGELAYMGSGCMVMCTHLGNYLIPPQRAVWVPPGIEHEWYLPEASVDCGLYIVPEKLAQWPRFHRYHAMEMTPLVREIILHLCIQKREYDEGPVSRLVDVLLDQLVELPEVDFPLSMPRDRRLVALCTSLLKEPDLSGTISQWCERLGMSERTLARLFQQQTGDSFGRWRQRVRLQYAAAQLAAGESVTTVAFNCGYTSVSAFIAAYKKLFGHTPGKRTA